MKYQSWNYLEATVVENAINTALGTDHFPTRLAVFIIAPFSDHFQTRNARPQFHVRQARPAEPGGPLAAAHPAGLGEQVLRPTSRRRKLGPRFLLLFRGARLLLSCRASQDYTRATNFLREKSYFFHPH